jgi:hypothetical protein
MKDAIADTRIERLSSCPPPSVLPDISPLVQGCPGKVMHM